LSAADGLRGYAICTEPRTGSSYLAQILTSTGRLGVPLEFFNGPGMARLQPGYSQRAEDQLGEILRQGATPNGVYGLKIFSAVFDRVAGTRWTERLPNLRFLSLTRRDLLGQAISSVRAAQTGFYSTVDGAGGEPFYDGDWILDEIHRAALGQARWTAFFARRGLQPLHLTYEEVAAEPQQAADAVARLVGLEGPAPVDPGQILSRVQRDWTSSEWRARFLAEARDPTRLDLLSNPSFAMQLQRRLKRRLRKWLRPRRA
jgi:LPS sulfotransferase NodH